MSIWQALGIWLLVSIALTPVIGCFLSAVGEKSNQSNRHTDFGAVAYPHEQNAAVGKGLRRSRGELGQERDEVLVRRHAACRHELPMSDGAGTNGEATDLEDVDLREREAAEPDERAEVDQVLESGR